MSPPTREFPPASDSPDVHHHIDRLARPPAGGPPEELVALRTHLEALGRNTLPPAQRFKALDLFHERSWRVADVLIPGFYQLRLPIPLTTRRSARLLQDVLELIASAHLDSASADERLVKGLRPPPVISLWRSVDALARHLFISDLISAPATPGIWRQLHQAMQIAHRLKVDQQTPGGVNYNIAARYRHALLLGCAPPSAFTAREWGAIDAYARCHAPLVRFLRTSSTDNPLGNFWLNPSEDAAPVAVARRPPVDTSPLTRFSCADLLALVDEHRRQLDHGVEPQALGFPEDLPLRLARVLLRRLKSVWGEPLKRRFPRRRQGYRVRLCFGFAEVWQMLRNNTPADLKFSEWMVTNESADGYATMHVAGKPQKVQIGDLVALRPEGVAEWQICIVRWALSENPEHLELGLQVLSPRAVPAFMAAPTQTKRQPVLLMPAAPPLRPRQSMATVPGLLMDETGKIALRFDTGTVEVREVTVAEVHEQSPDIDVFAIDGDGPAEPPR